MIFNIILSSILILSILIIVNLYYKLRKCEALLSNQEINNDLIYVKFYKDFTSMSNKLIAIDKKGSFKSEDEVGYAWKIFMDIIHDMDKLFKTILEKE